MLPDLTALGYFFGGVGTVTAARCPIELRHSGVARAMPHATVFYCYPYS
jgi:hypothetical protein